MKIVDSGHIYELFLLDNYPDLISRLTFVKRIGPKFPGNKKPIYPGTNCQEVLRCLIDRVKYLDKQIPCWQNKVILFLLRSSLNLFEWRAAKRHNRKFRWDFKIENRPFDDIDGHCRYY